MLVSGQSIYVGSSDISEVYQGSDLIWSKGGGHDYSKDYLTFEILTGGTIVWRLNNGDVTKSKTVSYSKNNGEWVAIASTTGGTSINVNSGDIVRFKGDTKGTGDGIYDSGYYSSFKNSTAYFNVYGNLLSIANSTGYTSAVTLSNSFKSLFYATNVVSAKNLIVPSSMTVGYELRSLFQGCLYLTAAPNLPSTSLTDSCYQEMFSGCTSLITGPSILPAASLPYRCYSQMFNGCTSLTTAPSALLATTLSEFCCYNMFHNCYSLTTAPTLPATTLAFYCYAGMFNGCSSLNYVKCLATDISANSCVSVWLGGVSSTGTFVKDSSMNDWPSGDSGIPRGWTVINE